MLALSLKQPWATLVAWGLKKFETRPHVFKSLANQWVAIQASQTFGPTERYLCEQEPFKSALAHIGVNLGMATHQDMPRGAVQAVVWFEPGLPTDSPDLQVLLGKLRKPDVELAFGDYRPRRGAYPLGTRFNLTGRAVMCPGRLGVFRLPAHVEREVRIQLQGFDDLPDDFRDEDMAAILIERAREQAQAEQQLNRLLKPGGAADRRTPIARMIDKAAGR